MSQENVELVRRALAELGHQNFAADFVWDMRSFRDYPWSKRQYRGWSGFLEFCEDWVGPYEEWEQEIEEPLAAPGDRTVVVTRQRGRLRDTDEWVEERYGLVYTLHGGLIRRAEMYRTPEEALEAAGLRE
jgi:ketosteroid isomerase-like protein